jgi:hypothetical protein
MQPNAASHRATLIPGVDRTNNNLGVMRLSSLPHHFRS